VSKTWVLIAAILGSAMTFIDATAVNVALPVMQRELQASSDQMQWVIESYALFLSALILAGGSLGDLYGRKKCFALGIALFALASAACALAPNVLLLIVARSVQGVGAALAMPESLALVSVAFTGAERGKAIGTWSGFASIMGAVGPLAGGFLAQTASWRWVFAINLPLAAVVLAIVVLRVPESRDERADRTVDWSGATLATLGLGALVYGLIRLQLPAAGAGEGAASAAAGSLLLVAFVIAQRRARHPMMPPGLFASRTFAVANLYTFALYLALGGSLYFFPYTLIDVQRYTPTAAGAAFLPFVILQFGLSRWSGGLSAKTGARPPLVIGAVLAGTAFVGFALPGIGGSYWTTYFPAVVLLGIGAAFFIAPLTTAVFDSSDPALSGLASATNNAIARTAGLLAIALLGILFSGAFARGFDRHIGATNAGPALRAQAVAERARFAAGTVPADVAPADRAAAGRALRSGYLDAFRTVMLASAGVAFLAALIAFVALPGRGATPLAPGAASIG
jgi:EmrB/QacA subfamily drug resistance transporter